VGDKLTAIPAVLESELLRDDPDLRDIVVEFLDSLEERVVEFQEANARLDWDQLTMLAHRLKGAGGSYGYADISRLGKIMEDAFRVQTADNFSAWIEQLRSLADAARAGLPKARRAGIRELHDSESVVRTEPLRSGSGLLWNANPSHGYPALKTGPGPVLAPRQEAVRTLALSGPPKKCGTAELGCVPGSPGAISNTGDFCGGMLVSVTPPRVASLGLRGWHSGRSRFNFALCDGRAASVDVPAGGLTYDRSGPGYTIQNAPRLPVRRESSLGAENRP